MLRRDVEVDGGKDHGTEALGSLLQWPTLLTLVMFPILTWAYVRLARREEREVRAMFGNVYARYAEATPAFIPRLRREEPRHG